MSERAPYVLTLRFPSPGQATAGTDESFTLGRAPFTGSVTAVRFAPDAAITGAATNHRAVRLRNRGQAGTGTTVAAELAFAAGVNAAAFDEVAIPLHATVANRDVAEGDILEWFSDAIGTGLADPGGLVEVDISRS